MLWDTIIDEISNFWDYLFFIEDKRELIHSALTKCQVANEILQKRPINVAQNIISFIHQTSNETLRTLGVSDVFVIIICAKKFIETHNLMDEVKDKAKKMASKCKILMNI